jgi:hypothetical protein
MLVIVVFTVFFLTRLIPWTRKLSTLDYLVYINLAYLASVYIRNPAGFWAMQTSMVGGRPYFEIGLAFGAFLIMSRVQVSDFLSKIFPMLFVVPAWGVAVLDAVARIVPQTAVPLAMTYSGIGSGAAGSGPTIAGVQEQARVGETRLTGMQNAGVSSILLLCAKYNPVTLISPLYPMRMLLFFSTLGAIFLSGFRSTLLFAMAAFLLASIMRRKSADLIVSASVGLLVVVLLVVMQGRLIQLPNTMQRALSWLPGDWSAEVLNDTSGSSQWRFEMWGWAWNDDRILKDKIWGQGFGLSLDDMNLIASSLMAGQGGASMLGGSDRENFLVMGAFHSGPLSTIKYIGIVGLSLYYPLMCYMALVGWKLCRRAYGTKVFPLALFVSIPVIYEPFNFVIVFGALDSGYPQLLFWAGLLNMTQRYLESVKSASPRATVGDYQLLSGVKKELQPAAALQPIAYRR